MRSYRKGVNHLYIDLLFVVNCLLDFLLLWATGFLSGGVIRFPRIIFAAVLGAAGACAAILFLPFHVARYPFSIAAAIGMTLIGFGRSRPRLVFLRTGLLYAFSCTIYGFLALITSDFGISKIPFASVVLSCAAGVLLSARLRSFRAFGNRKSQILPVILVRGEHRAEFRAFMDTGLTLICPISNRPVMVATYQAIDPLLSYETRAALSRIRDPTIALEILKKEGLHGVMLIPYRVVGSDSNLLCAFVPDDVIVNGKKCDIVVGITFSQLSESGNYEALSAVIE